MFHLKCPNSSNPSCDMFDKAQLDVFLANTDNDNEEEVCINMELISQGHALLDSPQQTEGESRSCTSRQSTAN